MGDIIKVLKEPNKILKRECTDYVSLEDGEGIVYELYKYADENPTVQGVAAPQLGYTKRICLCIFNKGQDRVLMINPRVLWSKFAVNSNEGCESCNGRYIVKRHIIGRVEWYDIDNNRHTAIFLYKRLRVIEHEIDHLNGLLISEVGTYWVGDVYLKTLQRRK